MNKIEPYYDKNGNIDGFKIPLNLVLLSAKDRIIGNLLLSEWIKNGRKFKI